MSAITTHVLDTATGQPASGVAVTLERQGPSGDWLKLAEGRTDASGRIGNLLPDDHALEVGFYQLRFETSARSPFFPEVVIRFRVDDPRQHYHIPLLLGPFSFTSYRGS
ncbi:MAG TPA: hydroxyisourate hydrolase [Terriglobia bacterium]|nr:hydroxyisourate hydrolase [Terriglobia bacterium]